MNKIKVITKSLRVRKNRDINSLTDFLMAIKNDEFKPDFSGKELEFYGPISLTNDKINSFAEVAIDLKFVHGLEIGSIDKYMPGLYVSSPVLTPRGEEYLRDQNLFKKHPFLEKIIIVLLTGVISALTTLTVQWFIN